jgi:predicted acetyltransferase
MNPMELVLPSAQYKRSFIEAVKEYQQAGGSDDRSQRYGDLSVSEIESDFAAYVEDEKSHALGKNLPEGYVPETTYWLIDAREFIGRVSIRHRFTEHLRQIGGLIGYDIRPSKRKRGYGTKILELALPKAKAIGLHNVLVTCDATNVGSRMIIEKNGGVLENQAPNPETGIDKLRFWINID